MEDLVSEWCLCDQVSKAVAGLNGGFDSRLFPTAFRSE